MRHLPLLSLAALGAAACNGGSAVTPSATPATTAPLPPDVTTLTPGGAPLVDATHLGWKSATCDSCHVLPVVDHTSVYAPECAACHGANGACDAAAVTEVTHNPALDCVECHGDRHDYAVAEDCNACHFAEAGLTDCGAPIPPPTDLVSDCHDWPNTPFSDDNIALVRPAAQVGQQAVDFTLRTPRGAEVRLTELLTERPVVLIFGSTT